MAAGPSSRKTRKALRNRSLLNLVTAFLFIGLPVFAAVGQPASDKGRLCVDDACVPGAYGHSALEVSETERPFVWASEDNLRVIAGTIPPGANVASLDRDLAVRKFTIITADGRRPWPSAAFEAL